ncbi:NACHT domain-containing protein [Spirillospora sp. CA-142024]|uniref:NACHT domain-containing protein n=1 Tax=Spirillospora sp. CA-142024 TaxID=3240036 RepID=UPI003D8E575C
MKAARELLDWIERLGTLAAVPAVAVLFFAFLASHWPAAAGAALLLAAVGVRFLTFRRRFGILERRRLSAYHRAEVEALAARLPVDGSTPLDTHEERLRTGFGFVDPSFSGSGALRDGRPIVDVVTDILRSGDKVMLMGEPGSGKSLIAALVFARLADEFAASPRKARCPLFLHLNAMKPQADPPDTGLTRAEEQALWLKDQLAAEVTLPDAGKLARLLDDGRIVLVCDGLDEAPVMRSPHLLTSIVPESLFGLFRVPSMLTSRTAFYSIYVDATELMSGFTSAGRLLPLRFEEQGAAFLRWYATARGHPELAGELIRIIGGNPSLREAVARPLILRMTAEVLLDLVLQDHDAESLLSAGHGGETSAVYSRYVDKWLQREQAKEPSKLTWWQKGELIECVAWEIFSKSLASGRGWGHFELKDLLVEADELRRIAGRWLESSILVDATVDEICRELVHRSFLIISNDRRRYRFVHKSFFEFCVARHVVRCLDERRAEHRADRTELLLHPLPDEVIDFVRELLLAVSSSPDERAATEATFLAILNRVDIDAGTGYLMAAQQAANLLPIVAGSRTMELLRSGELFPEHPFLQRAVAVADALHHDRHELLDEFVKRMETDHEAESFHMGYNRIYYGDQAFGDGLWLDDNHPECGRFFRATIRHVKSPAYRRIRVMDLYTVRALLGNPDRRRYLIDREERALRELESLTADPDPELGPECDRQRVLLREELRASLPETERRPEEASPPEIPRS